MTDLTGLSHHIWDMKYRFKKADGTPVDGKIQDTWRRVAKALAAAEKPSAQLFWEDGFYQALEGFKFLPAGRILAGAGTDRDVTPVQLFRDGRNPGRHGRHFRKSERSSPDPSAGRRHRLRLLDAPAQRRARARRGRRCLGPHFLHGCVGRHVPHDHVCGLQAWGDDGHFALRPSGHRSLYCREAGFGTIAPCSICPFWSRTILWRP